MKRSLLGMWLIIYFFNSSVALGGIGKSVPFCRILEEGMRSILRRGRLISPQVRAFSVSTQKKASHEILQMNSVEDFPLKSDKAIESMKAKGWCVFEMQDSSQKTLLELSKFFGKRQRNNSADEEGVSDIVDNLRTNTAAQIVSRTRFFPHTDGAYLNGMIRSGKKMRRILPPKFVLLQCIETAEKGGETLLIDGQKILADLIEKSPKMVAPLFANCTYSHHNELVAMGTPVFRPRSLSSYSIRWSYDKELYFPDWAKDALDTMNHKYVENAEYVTQICLSPSQILVVDNTRLLHGRTAFEGKRFYRRLWIHDDIISNNLSNAAPSSEEVYRTHREDKDGLQVFQNFLPIEHKALYKGPIIPHGIVLPRISDLQLKSLLQEGFVREHFY